MSRGSFPHAFKVKRGRRREAALNDHALPAASVIVARSAVNVVALAAAFQILTRHGERKFVCHDAVLFTGVKQFVNMEMPARYRAGNHRPFGAAIIEEGAGLVGLSLIHILDQRQNDWFLAEIFAELNGLSMLVAKDEIQRDRLI